MQANPLPSPPKLSWRKQSMLSPFTLKGEALKELKKFGNREIIAIGVQELKQAKKSLAQP